MNHPPTQPIFVSIIPNLLGGGGHVYTYHRAVQDAASRLDWPYQAIVAPDPALPDLPLGWLPCLTCPNLETETNPIVKALNVRGMTQWANQLADALHAILSTGKPVILLMERFIPSQLVGLWLALRQIPTDRVTVWLFYRRDVHRLKIRSVYKLLNGLIQRQLPPQHLQLLTDSELIATALATYFQAPLTVMPIPHTTIDTQHPFAKAPGEVVCWWAGSPRPEKGWSVMHRLATLSPGPESIRLVAAASAQLQPTPHSVAVQPIADNLSQQEYHRWLATSDITLIPYEQTAYQERTSGVFVESVIAGKLPIVTKDTWMAYELTRHNLAELIVDWQDDQVWPEFWPRCVAYTRTPDILEKMNQMQAAYLAIHTPAAYAKAMAALWMRSQD